MWISCVCLRCCWNWIKLQHFFFSHRSIKITLKHKYRVSRTLEFICFCICRFTYEIAPVFVLMEQLTLKKMREIIGWPESEGDGIFSPGESQSTPEIKQTQQTSMCTVIILLFLQEERSPTCTAWWSPDTSSSLKSRPKAWQLHPDWSSSPQSTSVSITARSVTDTLYVGFEP